jgi:pimeloyl-ACP methyl ester carboxylesterase
MLRAWALAIAAALTLLGGCARVPAAGAPAKRLASWSELRAHLLAEHADVDRFRLRGPFAVTVKKDFALQLSGNERIEADLYVSACRDKAPLVILLHGQDNSKADHAYQALHLASWGMHSLVLQLPNNGPWTGNGRTLARVVSFIRGRAHAIDAAVDANRIVLAGHSFGASAVTIALGLGAAAVGGVLLDPAGAGRALPEYLKAIRVPVMILGSDSEVTLTRRRHYFYQYISRDVAEVSIKDAHHQDAQFPLDVSERAPASYLEASESLQVTFVSALTAAAFSLASGGTIDYAWKSFGTAIRSGKLFDAKRK